jgi:hypothetical protein
LDVCSHLQDLKESIGNIARHALWRAYPDSLVSSVWARFLHRKWPPGDIRKKEMLTWFKKLLHHLRSTGVRAGAANPRIPQPPIRPASLSQTHLEVFGRPSQPARSSASVQPPSRPTSPGAQPPAGSEQLPSSTSSNQQPTRPHPTGSPPGPTNMDLDGPVPTDAMAALRRTINLELQNDTRRRAATSLDCPGITSLLAAAAEVDTPNLSQPIHTNPNPSRVRSPSPALKAASTPAIPSRPDPAPEPQRPSTPPPGPRLPHKERVSRPREVVILDASNCSPAPTSPRRSERYRPYPSPSPPHPGAQSPALDSQEPTHAPTPQPSAPLPTSLATSVSPLEARLHSPHPAPAQFGEEPQPQSPRPGTVPEDPSRPPATQPHPNPAAPDLTPPATPPPLPSHPGPADTEASPPRSSPLPPPQPPELALTLDAAAAFDNSGDPHSPTSASSDASTRTLHEREAHGSRKRPRPNTVPAPSNPHGALGRRRGWPNNLLQAWRNAKKRPNLARRMWSRGTLEERKKMFLAASPGLRREILTWVPDVPCTADEISALTGSLSLPAVFEDPAPLSTQLQSWMRSERDPPYSEPLPAPTPSTPAPAVPAAEDPEEVSHNWEEGARIGEASNPGPVAPSSALQPQQALHTILQQLIAVLQQLQPATTATSPTHTTNNSRRRQERRKPGQQEQGWQPSPRRPPHRKGHPNATSSPTVLGVGGPTGPPTRPILTDTRTTWVTPATRNDRQHGANSSRARAPPQPSQQQDPQLCQYGSTCLNQPHCPLLHPPPYKSFQQNQPNSPDLSHSRGVSSRPTTNKFRPAVQPAPNPPPTRPRGGRQQGRGLINHAVDYGASGQLLLNPSHVGSPSDSAPPPLPPSSRTQSKFNSP